MNNDDVTVNFVTSTDEIVASQNIQAATSIIDFHSNGHCLIIGDDIDAAMDAAAQLTELKCTVVSKDASIDRIDKRLTEAGTAAFVVPDLSVIGYLGAFDATVELDGQATSLGVSVYLESGLFDLVLDLNPQATLSVSLAPLGYYHAPTAEQLQVALIALPELVGEFEKPKYFNYDVNICAHSRSELTGCNACLNACATNAISSDGEGIVVDPHLCQGCGSCSTVCPSGAISYAYPKPADAIERTREMLQSGGQRVLLLHNEAQQTQIDAIGEQAGVLTLLVEEVSAFGMDYWASMLCAGVHHILLLIDDDMDELSLRALRSQTGVLHELLGAMGVVKPVVSFISSEKLVGSAKRSDSDKRKDSDKPIDTDKKYSIDPDQLQQSRLATLKVANFAIQGNKRQTVRMALDTLSERLQPAKPVVNLSKGAPFGVIDVNKDNCTLCMACVSVCPAKALLDGQDTPALRMIEANCLQCGLCEAACPESAISLNAQYTFDSIEARKISTLNEEEPFNCIRCYKPFATKKIIQSMFSKLEGHWMFKDDVAKRRLKMCDDCRVKDIFEQDAKGIDVHKNDNV